MWCLPHADRKYLGAKPGITAVLHTWGQNLQFHPHVHMIVTGGGLTPAFKWRESRQDFFLPVHVLSAKFRGKFMALLKKKFPDTDKGGVSKYRFELNKKFCKSSTQKPDIDNQPNNDAVHLMRL